MKEKYKLAFMDMAKRFGQTSEAMRLKVGALIVKNDSIISEGCNGTPPDWHTNICEDKIYSSHKRLKPNEEFPYVDEEGFRHTLVTKPEVRHAEIAALEKIWKKHETTEGAEMYVSHSPCLPCAIKLKTAGIIKVYYSTNYRSSEGVEYLRNHGIEVEQLP